MPGGFPAGPAGRVADSIRGRRAIAHPLDERRDDEHQPGRAQPEAADEGRAATERHRGQSGREQRQPEGEDDDPRDAEAAGHSTVAAGVAVADASATTMTAVP